MKHIGLILLLGFATFLLVPNLAVHNASADVCVDTNLNDYIGNGTPSCEGQSWASVRVGSTCVNTRPFPGC
jgi:hypothetical protein